MNYFCLFNQFKKFFCFFSNHTWVLKGYECNTNQALILVYHGKNVDKNFYKHHLFNGKVDETSLGIKMFWQIRPLLKQYPDNLAMIEGNWFTRLFLKQRSDFYIPMWIKGYHDIPFNTAKKDIVPLLRNIKNHRLTYQVSDSEQDVDIFIHNMYLPYMRNRFGDESQAQSEQTIRIVLSRCRHKVLFVTQKGEPVAGMLLIFYNNKPPYIWLLGVKDGNFEHVRHGAAAAAYYYSGEYLASLGFGEMYSGATRPFLKDGILAYKKKWGFRLVSRTFNSMLLKPNGYSAAKAAFLSKNPFVYMSGRSMNAAIFLNENQNTVPVINKKIRKLGCEGLHQVRFYHISDENIWLQPIKGQVIEKSMVAEKSGKFRIALHLPGFMTFK